MELRQIPPNPAGDGKSRFTYERPEESGKQDRRPGRRHVQPRVPVRGPTGRDRAQARPGNGGAQVVLGVAHVCAERVSSVPLPPRSRAICRLRSRVDGRARRVSARTCAKGASDAVVSARDRVRDRRPPRPGRVRHPDARGPARRRAGQRSGRGTVGPHDGLQQRRASLGAARGARTRPRPEGAAPGRRQPGRGRLGRRHPGTGPAMRRRAERSERVAGARRDPSPGRIVGAHRSRLDERLAAQRAQRSTAQRCCGPATRSSWASP